MKYTFAKRMNNVHRSFIREILEVTQDPEVISFAGGLPNPSVFPIAEFGEVIARILKEDGPSSLQYSATGGYLPLREAVAARYMNRFGLKVSPEDLIITTGSQQGLDLVAKVLMDPGDRVILEKPGYLGAIQAFSLFEPEMITVPLQGDGPDIERLEKILGEGKVKAYYAVPNFQNPSGQTYSLEKRQDVAKLCKEHGVVFLEDDPYGELRFKGADIPPVYSMLEEKGVLFGSFSKIGVPGFRVGWVLAEPELMEKLVTVKQAADLHTSTFTQRIASAYLAEYDMDEHVEQIRKLYGRQRDCMVAAIEEHFPPDVSFTRPDGGMFLWVTLPEGCSSMELFEQSIAHKVAFVPGRPFFVDDSGDNSLRLNFSNSDEKNIEEGIRRLGGCIREFMAGSC